MKEVEFTVKSPISRPVQSVFHRRQGLPKEKEEAKPVSVTSAPQAQAAPAGEEHDNVDGDNLLSASQVREIRLKWSDKVESLRDIQNGNYDDRMVTEDNIMDDKMKMMDDKREKRFLDPEGALDSSFVEAGDNSLNLNTTEEPVLGVDYSDDEEDEGPQDEDPHKDGQQFCVDISEYLDLKWVIKDEEECHVEFNRFLQFIYVLLLI